MYIIIVIFLWTTRSLIQDIWCFSCWVYAIETIVERGFVGSNWWIHDCMDTLPLFIFLKDRTESSLKCHNIITIVRVVVTSAMLCLCCWSFHCWNFPCASGICGGRAMVIFQSSLLTPLKPLRWLVSHLSFVVHFF